MVSQIIPFTTVCLFCHLGAEIGHYIKPQMRKSQVNAASRFETYHPEACSQVQKHAD